MTSKLTLDLIITWTKQTSKNYQLLLIVMLLAIPVSVLLNVKMISSSYLTPTYTGIENYSLINNLIAKEGDKSSAIDNYLVDPIIAKWPSLKVIYEESTSLKLTGPENSNVISVSFFSGGYSTLGINAFKGTLKALEFPTNGSDLVAAISYSYWQNKYKGKEVINTILPLNGKAVKIVAIMPENFTAFNKQYKTDVVIPYSQKLTLIENTSNDITPNTFSYLLGSSQHLAHFSLHAKTYLSNELLITDDIDIVMNNAIGINNSKYQKISKRIDILVIIFSILLVFCFVSFITFYVGEYASKSNELSIRGLCGASKKQLLFQRAVENTLLIILITIVCIAILPIGKMIVHSMLPTVNFSDVDVPTLSFLKLILCLTLLITLIMAITFFIQETFISKNIGRGENITLSQKLQSYILLSFLLSVAIVSIFISLELLSAQKKLNENNNGFITNNRYIASFELPKTVQTQIASSDTGKLLVNRLENIPNVQSAALTLMAPFANSSSFFQWYTVDGHPVGSGINSQTVSDRVSPNYFAAIGATFVKGKSFSWQSSNSIVVNHTLWQRYFKGLDLYNAKLIMKTRNKNGVIKEHPFQIIGVVKDIYIAGPDVQPNAIVYALTNFLVGAEAIIIHSSNDEKTLKNAVTAQLNTLDVSFKKLKLTSLESLVGIDNQPRNAILLTTIIATLTITISSIIFCLSVVNQIVEKSARAYAINKMLGATNFRIMTFEARFLMAIFLPIVFLSIFIQLYYALQANFIAANINLTTLVSITITVIAFILAALYININNKLHNSWHYLT